MSNISYELRLDKVTYEYDNHTFYFDCRTDTNSISALVGASGSGKSTLISLIGGFLQPTSGRIYVGNQDITDLAPSQRPLTILFQENNLFSHLNVFDNIALGRSAKLKLSSQDKEDIYLILEKLGLKGKEYRNPNNLSGGEKQRVAIARTLLRNKPILILDEPFSGLGPGMRKDLLSLLLHFRERNPFTLLLVTHEPSDIFFLDGYVFFLNDNKISEHGLAKDILSPAGSAAVKKYLGI